MKELKLKAEIREEKGKSVAKKLRRSGEIPCIIYGHGEPAISSSVKQGDFEDVLKRNPHGVGVVNIEIKGKETFWCLIKDIQRDPITEEILHIDFQHLHKGEKISLDVPIKAVGTPVGEKEGGVLEQITHEVRVSVLPSSIMSVFSVDVSNLEIGDAIHLGEVNIGDAELEDNPERTVFNVIVPKVIEIEKPEPEEVLEGLEEEVEGEEVEEGEEKKPEEGEEKAEEEQGKKEEKSE